MGDPATLRWLGVGLVSVGGLAWLALTLIDPESALTRRWVRHTRQLERESRFLRLDTTGVRIATLQVIAIAVLALVAVVVPEPVALVVVPVVAFGPSLILARLHRQRVEAIERQIDGWLLVLSNALRAAPSLGDAIESSVRLVDAPLAEELDTAVKEMRLGTPVDRAVLELGTRTGSRTVQGALAAILVGRQTGGELSTILEETAASIREMTRLEGVLRAKTAEGRSQAYVLAAIPFFLIVAIEWVDPHWLDPLTATPLGLAVTALSMGLWLVAVVLARRILAVDL